MKKQHLKHTAIVLGAVFLLSPFVSFAAIENIQVTSGGAYNQTIGSTNSGSQAWEISYIPTASHNICSAQVYLTSFGSPADSLQLYVYYGGQVGGSAGTTTSYLGTTLPAETFSANQAIKPPSVFLRNADSSWQVTSSGSYTYNFTPCLPVAALSQYWFVLARTGSYTSSNGYAILHTPNGWSSGGAYSNATSSFYYNNININSGGTLFALQNLTSGTLGGITFILNGSENYGVVAIPPPSFAQSIINTLAGVSDSNASSTLTSAFTNFLNLPQLLYGKFPFNWLVGFGSALDQLTVSTTSSFYTVTLDFPFTGTSTGSTSPIRGMGQLIPSSWTVLSSSTISTYYPDGIRLTLWNLVAAIVDIGFFFYAFRRVLGLMASNNS